MVARATHHDPPLFFMLQYRASLLPLTGQGGTCMLDLLWKQRCSLLQVVIWLQPQCASTGKARQVRQQVPATQATHHHHRLAVRTVVMQGEYTIVID